MKNTLSTANQDKAYGRQIAFLAAFLLPTGKLLEAPSLLAGYAKGDILLPALVQFLAQGLLLLGILYASSRSEKTLLERLEDKLGKGVRVLFILYFLYYLLASVLPLLDLEKFVYAVYFDTAPTTFSFGLFFVLAAFVCAKGLKSLARLGDLCLLFFLLPFFALLVMALFEADLTHLLPLFGTPIEGAIRGVVRSTPHFSDAALLLPLLVTHRYKEGDGKKIAGGYLAGGVMTLFFLAVFFGVFSTIAPREHYALSKIASYFPALQTVGRIDLIFVYLLSVLLLFYTALPLLFATNLAARTLSIRRKSLPAALLSFAAFLFILFANRYYNAFYEVVSGKLYPVFWLMSALPLCLLILPVKEDAHAA